MIVLHWQHIIQAIQGKRPDKFLYLPSIQLTEGFLSKRRQVNVQYGFDSIFPSIDFLNVCLIITEIQKFENFRELLLNSIGSIELKEGV